MNGPQHYAEADRLLAGVDWENQQTSEAKARVARARAHAALAMTAAIVEGNDLVTFEVAGTGASGLTDWGKAVRKP